jgi:hypothetical protein
MKTVPTAVVLTAAALLSASLKAVEKPSQNDGPEGKDAAAAVAPKADDTEKPVPKKNDEKRKHSQKADGRRAALKSLVILKVLNPREARAAIKAEAERLKGFMSYSDDAGITVKLPPEVLADMVARAAEQGMVIEKSLEREDLTLEIAELEGRLKSKREILARLRGFFDDSDAVATLEIEQTMNGLVMEIEQVQGRLRVLNDRADWAVLSIAFRFRERDRVVYVQSPFEWLNTASLDRFLQEF